MRKLILTIGLLLAAVACRPQADNASSYKQLKEEIAAQRMLLAKAYQKAGAAQRDSLLKAAHQYLFTQLTEHVFTAWYGTPWTFEGHSQTPKQGSIACGYFITTTLQDAGFNLPRVKWAQLASEQIICKLTTDVKRFRNASMSEVTTYINSKGNGLYIVGLDIHVGFIVKKDSKLQFVHANYYQPKIGVMAEPLVGWNPLYYSKYRVIGKILDNTMMERWLTGYKYESK